MNYTLKNNNITWNITTNNGNTSCIFNNTHEIVYNKYLNEFRILECGDIAFVADTVLECLDAANEIILDYIAEQISPTWNI